MTHIILWLFIALLLDRTQLMLAKANYGVKYNGFGAIPGVLARDGYAPQVYRVLVPWLVAPFWKDERRRLVVYELCKIVLMAAAFWMIDYVWGWQVTLLVAAMITCTFEFDYWDWCGELIGIMCCLTGNIFIAAGGVVIHGLSKETVLIAPLAFAIGLHNRGMLLAGKSFLEIGIIGGLTLLMWVIVRAIQGKHAYYCERFTWFIRNLVEIKGLPTYVPWFSTGIFLALLFTALTIGLSWMAGWSAVIPIAFLIANWTLTGADEVRVFTPVLPWIAYAIIRISLP
jgi:hypothetical protein